MTRNAGNFPGMRHDQKGFDEERIKRAFAGSGDMYERRANSAVYAKVRGIIRNEEQKQFGGYPAPVYADRIKMILKDAGVSRICGMKIIRGYPLVGQVLGPEFVVLFDRLIGQIESYDPDDDRNDTWNDQDGKKCTDDLYESL